MQAKHRQVRRSKQGRPSTGQARQSRGPASSNRGRVRVNWRRLEAKWQRKWAESKIFETDPKPGKDKFFVTVAYPYVNSPQHIGHARTYTMGDVDARYHRMRGLNTLFPVGFHYTGTPIAAMSKRLSQGDKDIIETFREIYHVPESELRKMGDPYQLARYFHQEIRQGMKEVGYGVDWRREFSTIDPIYSRFIQWQFQRLRDNGRITRGTHPVGWCPNDKSPVGMHDTMGDAEPEIGEFFLVKFEVDGVVLPTATLRPETVYGVTNLWINPESSYVQVDVDGEQWIISRDTIPKLESQNHKVTNPRDITANDLLGRMAFNPIAHNKIPVLPGSFVDPKNGTGLVMSVPGHAPYDYQALLDLKTGSSTPALASPVQLTMIEPVSIIEVEGYSELPARDIVGKFNVSSQTDKKLEDATRELYSAELRRGRMRSNAGAYSGMDVAKAREMIAQDYTSRGMITKMYEIMNRPVICRCGTEVLVKILEDQWFIDYGESDWKRLAHECLDSMTLLPEEIRAEFNYAIDWLKEKACARRIGLGTPLPWDKSWVIEALSDSTIYMAYYILAKYIGKEWMTFKRFEKNPDRLMDEFFDYIYLGKGDSKEVSTITDIPKRVLESIRKEFEYFYPVDMRHSAKELIPNHFSFYIFNHVALFPRHDWPRGIAANGHVLMSGQKMSKSLQNIIPLRQAIQKFGADPIRIGVLATAEIGQDTDFSEELARSIQERLVDLLTQSKRLGSAKGAGMRKDPSSTLDRWMLHRLNETIRSATMAMDSLRVREVIQKVLYQLDNDVAWYLRRLGPAINAKGDDAREKVLRTVLEVRARMLAPLAPHTMEEIWSNLGGKGLVSVATWPETDDRQSDPIAEVNETLVKQVMEDTSEILKATGMQPQRITYYTAPDWKWQVQLKALDYAENPGSNPGEFIKTVMTDPEIRGHGKQAADYSNRAYQQARQLQDLRAKRINTGVVDETRVLKEAGKFFEREFHAETRIWKAGEKDLLDPKDRARLAEPYRPAIYIE